MGENKQEGENDVFLPVGRAADYLDVTVVTLKKYIKKQRLKAALTDPVGRLYFSRESLDAIRQEILDNKARIQRRYNPGEGSEE